MRAINRTGNPQCVGLCVTLLVLWGCQPSRSPESTPDNNISEPPGRPNIVMLIADDMGWGDVGYLGSEIRTPELDRLAAEGMRLNRFYTQPVCSPARATLMTGRVPIRTGVYGPTAAWNNRGMDLNEKFMPEYFREAGYRTLAVGKWHLGPNDRAYHPMNHGFDHFYGFLHGFINYDLHSTYGRIDWQRNGTTVREDGYSTRLIGVEAVRLIRERDPERPMFLYVAFNAPHVPLQAPEETIAEYSWIEDPVRRTYAAMVTELDRSIAAITTALEEEGLLDNTLLLFFSDNGGALRHGASNGRLRGEKGHTFEGGIRVPALAYWPGTLDRSTFDEQITVMDLLPTLASATVTELNPPRPVDGRDLWGSLKDGVPPPDIPRKFFGLPPGLDALGAELRYAYFRDRWKLVRSPNEEGDLQVFLFDIRNDPYEESDLSAEFPDVLAGLVAEVESLPRLQSVTYGETVVGAELAGLGGPAWPEPDYRVPTGTPYAEEEDPIVHYRGNWWERIDNN